MRRMTLATVARYVVLSVLALLELVPLAILLIVSLKTQGQIAINPLLPVPPFHFENYSVAWRQVQRYMLNSATITLSTLLGNMLLSVIAAYVFARHSFPGKNVLYGLIIGLMMIPGVSILIPRFILVRDLRLLNSLSGVIIPGIFAASGFNIFVLRTFFESLPEELYESARLDGAGHFVLLSKITVPLSWPILSSLSILQILWTWNDYIWPLMVLQSDSLRTIAIGLVYFADSRNPQLGVQMAGSVIAAIPLFILFFLAMRTFIEGLTTGALKL
ncbi:MAG: carbohydrate ABC transporter permease [Anaerolineae bacterium]|nr:carbohydrate ABC transporter permease [Anaerolineae bacterium]